MEGNNSIDPLAVIGTIRSAPQLVALAKLLDERMVSGRSESAFLALRAAGLRDDVAHLMLERWPRRRARVTNEALMTFEEEVAIYLGCWIVGEKQPWSTVLAYDWPLIMAKAMVAARRCDAEIAARPLPRLAR